VTRFISFRGALVAAYLVAALALIALVGSQLGRGIFPVVDAGQFRLRMRAPDGMHIARTEELAQLNSVARL
jgi:multidrug efflux pump subunit AcrB